MCNVWSDAKDILNQQIKAKSHLISAKTNTMPILTKVFHITSDTLECGKIVSSTCPSI